MTIKQIIPIDKKISDSMNLAHDGFPVGIALIENSSGEASLEWMLAYPGSDEITVTSNFAVAE